MSRPDETSEDEYQEQSHSLTLPIFMLLCALVLLVLLNGGDYPLNRISNSVMENFPVSETYRPRFRSEKRPH